MNPSNLIRFASVAAVFALVGCGVPMEGEQDTSFSQLMQAPELPSGPSVAAKLGASKVRPDLDGAAVAVPGEQFAESIPGDVDASAMKVPAIRFELPGVKSAEEAFEFIRPSIAGRPCRVNLADKAWQLQCEPGLGLATEREIWELARAVSSNRGVENVEIADR